MGRTSSKLGRGAGPPSRAEQRRRSQNEQEISDSALNKEDYDYEEWGYRWVQSPTSISDTGQNEAAHWAEPQPVIKKESAPVAPEASLMSIGLRVQGPQGPVGRLLL